MRFSVIIPTRDEGSQIYSSLRRLREISKENPPELIVADGGSQDDTVPMAREWADHIVVVKDGDRGALLDAGARKASGDLLFFLLPDAQPPGNWQQALEHFWLSERPEKVSATVFRVDYGSSPAFRLVSALSNALAAAGAPPNGDHGFCTTPELYRESGGFPSGARREDLVFAGRLKRLGRIAVLDEKIWPAARRMHSAGAFSCVLRGALERFGAS